jgi:hypothetical protein
MLIGSLGNDSERGQIPPEYRLITPPTLVPEAPSFNTQLKNAALRTQNYDKGLDRFIHHYGESKCLAATMVLAEGKQQGHAYAVYFVEEQKRCLLLNSMYGQSSTEVFWTAMAKWANFRPNPAKLRNDPGTLFFPVEAAHTRQKYWDYLPCLDRHALFSQESPYTQQQMCLFSLGFSQMPNHADCDIRPDADATQKEQDIAHDAAVSRLRPIQDRSSGITDTGGPAPS